ncbi:hypothetical protein [Methyloversatilis sp.]|uniref:hypothetical protein n=1 Tax=Methyloversatilis sp. TaxID=2569862 RepID=UPI003F6FB638
MLKRMYSLSEAAEFLSAEYKTKHTERDVIIAAAHGDLRLCAWFEGTVGAFEERFDEDPVLLGEPGPPLYWHYCHGYAEIPRELIRPDKSDLDFHWVNIVSVAWSEYENPPEQIALGVHQHYMLFTFRPETGLPEVVPIRCNLATAEVPASDLLGFAPNKSTTTQKTAADTRVQNTLLSIIAALVDQAGIDPTARGAARRVEEWTQHMGCPVGEETIKKYLDMLPEVLERQSRR